MSSACPIHPHIRSQCSICNVQVEFPVSLPTHSIGYKCYASAALMKRDIGSKEFVSDEKARSPDRFQER
jgi:hypothetical protein